MHRYTKECLLGIDGNDNNVSCYSEWTEVLSVSDKDDAEQRQWKKRLLQASICEHLRWNAAHLMMGYVPMSEDKAERIGSSADEQRKEHRYIVHWNQLDIQTQGYDYGVVKTTINLKNRKNVEG